MEKDKLKYISTVIHEAGVKAGNEAGALEDPVLGGDVQWPISSTINKGLDGAIATETKIGYVDGVGGRLVYRGLNCFALSENSTFEETSYLLIFGKLPVKKELNDFKEKLIENRKIPDEVIRALKEIPIKQTHPMTALYMGVSMLGSFDEKAEDSSIENETEIGIKLISKMAAIAGVIARLRVGKEPIEPDLEIGHAANFLYMMTGEKPDPVTERIMDIALILHADHGMNASTFAAMVTNSTLSDLYSSIVSGIATLKGPLHGGANEKVLYDLESIGDIENVETWFRNAREQKRKIMGFGHRVYKAYDPRARILSPLVAIMAEKNSKIQNLYAVAQKLDEVVCRELGKEKQVLPNVDFYSGLIYKAMGIETAMFTPIFAVSRISGWTARVLEYLAHNRIFRPRAAYTGPPKAEYISIDKR